MCVYKMKESVNTTLALNVFFYKYYTACYIIEIILIFIICYTFNYYIIIVLYDYY